MRRWRHPGGTAPAAGRTVPALALALALGLTACTGDSGGTGGVESKSGSSATSPQVKPGKYDTLPEPCGAVEGDMLSELLPLAESRSPDSGETPRAHEGEAVVTYDTDRRVGCRWKSTTGEGTRHLLVDFERVVSYDGVVSDEDRAGGLFDRKVQEAELRRISMSSPAAAGSPGQSPGSTAGTGGKSGANSSDTGDGGDGGEGAEDGGADAKKGDGKGEEGEEGKDGGATPDGAGSATDGSPGPGTTLTPRRLDDLADSAFIDDVLDTTDSGVHRDVTLVFRAANVLVTVEYSQWMTDTRRIPDSAELQQKAEALAEQLAAAFED